MKSEILNADNSYQYILNGYKNYLKYIMKKNQYIFKTQLSLLNLY